MIEVLTALSVMIAATLIQHLGLAEAVCKIIDKIFSCHQCFTFWLTLTAMLYIHANIIVSVVLSILMSYASNWFVLLLVILQGKFTEFYGKEKDRRGRGKEADTTINN